MNFYLFHFILLSLLITHLSFSHVLADSHFEGFDAEDDETVEEEIFDHHSIRSPPVTKSDSHPLLDLETQTHPDPNPIPASDPPSQSDIQKASTTSFEYWDEDEFEGLTVEQPSSEPAKDTENATPNDSDPKTTSNSQDATVSKKSFTVEIVCGSFLIVFLINYLSGKRENENLALAWAAKFATKVVPCKDEITFEVYMNDEAMDQVIFAVAKKKAAKGMQKEVRDLQRFAVLIPNPIGRKWVVDELSVISESKEVAGDLITEAVLEQVFGEKAYEKHGKNFISMHFSDQYPGMHRKMLLFKFALPDANNMADMTRLVALKTETARVKAAQEAYKELQNARQEALQRKKAEKKKMLEEAEAEAKLSAEAVRKREAKERARQMKKAVPKMKMTRAR
ncbi:hypothetical protein F3Y22_tig00007895pilonHSYRG00059 [Hibiscus syriacus]|uniref:Uncharacterized protein n=1 Tax=Hibiscus syriacus TaxID=106335 RepID=A0A6A3C9S0_HIBSY|nr:hypothetical protein F3Y22_tig00007895pilonHSYRG00059 [Hibiscus syriacus]